MAQVEARPEPGERASPRSASEAGRVPPRFPKAIKHLQSQQKPASRNWLLDADNDTERFRRLQSALGGSDMQMSTIALRFEEIYVAINKNNPAMGAYHLGKIVDYMNVMAMKRPNRTPNLEGMFIEGGVYQALQDALRSGDPLQMRTQFLVMRQTCMACHVAEKVDFINDSSVFDRTERFPSQRH